MVGRYRPNQYGLHDMYGNMWEPVQDCWNNNYRSAPSDGSAWESGDCSRRVLRGGSWVSDPGVLRSAARAGLMFSNFDVGIRVARTVTP